MTGGKRFTKVRIKIRILPGYALSSLLFVVAMVPLNHILRKYVGGYKITKSQENINHLMYLEDVKLFTKK